MGLTAGYLSRKRKAETPLYIGPVTVANKKKIKMSTWPQRRERDVTGTVCSKLGKKLYMDAIFAMQTCIKMDVILPTIINNIKLLIFLFLETSINISPKCFMSIVRLI